MASSISRLPTRFPIGTKFVIEARSRGRGQILSRHVEFPDGTLVRLPEQPAKIVPGEAAPAPRRRRARRSH
jgi:hypothetical protein